MHELILGGCHSGKSHCAEQRAADWLALPGRSACLLATALPADDEMRERIARHRSDLARAISRLEVIDVPTALPEAVEQLSASHHLLVIDCLTLWLTNLRMPLIGPPLGEADCDRRQKALIRALGAGSGPVVLVSNEIGWGASPLGRDARRFVESLGALHQRVAAVCDRVTLMVAGMPLNVKGPRL